jgi:dipeptidyl aminopeptidase/acylaminoacyl peptidase
MVGLSVGARNHAAPPDSAAAGRTHTLRARAFGVVVLLAIGAACSSGNSATTSRSATSTTTTPALTFYRPPDVLDTGHPGDVLNAAPIALDPSLPGTGQKITYVSTTPAGDRIPVTGVLIRPLTPAPKDGYPVVTWAHGTVGVGDKCAPSLVTPFTFDGAREFLAAGYAIAATDYAGLGTPDEIHPYLVGESEGRSVLDAARAARSIGAGSVTVAFGWSQGGHAALFAGELAHAYAPDLDFRGVAAQAPVTDSRTFLLPGVTDPLIFPFTAEAILAWSEVYHEASLTDLVVVEDAERARLAEQSCTGDIRAYTERPLDEIFRSDPQNTAVWNTAASINSASADGLRAPVLLTHGDADPLVPVSGTTALHVELCDAGSRVQYLHDPAWDHNSAHLATMQDVEAWITARVNGDKAPSDCT